MKIFVIIALLVASSAAATPGQSAYLDVQKRFYIEWDYDDTNITILARVKTTGWFGIGFSPNGGMAGADIITAGVRDGVPYLQDRFAERNGYPKTDLSQDVHLISGSEVNGETTIKFTRKHSTCDDEDMPIMDDGTMRIIYAISPDGTDDLKYHKDNRGTRSLYLRKQLTTKATIPDNAFTYDVTVQNIEIPAYHTRYYCEVKKVPKLPKKHHMIKVEPLIQKENLGIVHHIIVYGCYDKKDRDHYFSNNNTGFDCYNGNMPQDIDVCRSPIVVWAIGGGDMYYPAEAGFPFGEGTSPDYVMMEVHYDNPQLISGLRDNSGVRLTLTETLRPNDAAIIGAGAVFGIAVPPGVKDFQHNALCTSECTKKLMKKPTKIVGAFLHGHLAARGIIARHFRDGKELAVLDQDRHYDFNYQQYRVFDKAVDFLPGDSILVTCHYNTEGRKVMTYGNLPSLSEMCIAFLTVYPAPDMSECYSLPGWAVDAKLGYELVANRFKYDKPVAPGTDSVTLFNKMVRDGDWSDERVKYLEDSYLSMPHMDSCTNRARKVIFGFGEKQVSPIDAMKVPMIDKDEDRNCKKTSDTAVGK